MAKNMPLVAVVFAMMHVHVSKGGGSRIASRRTTSFYTSGCFFGHHMWVDKT
jgi:hypothetical protein